MIYAFFYAPQEPEPEEPVTAVRPTEQTKVVAWRRDQLKRAGYGDAEAVTLAENLDVDLHHAVELLEQGCPPERAVFILV